MATTGAAAGLLLPGLVHGPSQDAAVYTAVAVRLRSGADLYAAAWDHKPPGVYLIDEAAQSALPWLGPWIPIWLVSVLAVASCAWMVDAFLRSNGASARAGLVGALFVAIGLALPPIAQGGGHTEHLALVPAVAAFGLAARDSRLRDLVGAGLLLGSALAISFQLAPAVIGVAALAGMRGSRGVRLLSLAAGLLVPALSAVLALLVAGLLPDAWDAVIGYSAAYRSMNLAFQGPNFASALGAGILATAVVMLPIGMGIVGYMRAAGPARAIGVGCIAWLSAGALWIAFQGRLEGHYVAAHVPPAGILFGMGIERLLHSIKGRPGALLLLGFPIVLLGSVSAAVVVNASLVVMDQLSSENRSARAVAAEIADDSSPDGTVFVWGNRPQVLYLSGRHSVTHYLYLAPLTTPGYSSPSQVAGELASWENAPPAFIVDAGSRRPNAPGLPPLLIERPISANGRDYDVLEPLREFVRDRYKLVGIVDGWPVYQRIAR